MAFCRRSTSERASGNEADEPCVDEGWGMISPAPSWLGWGGTGGLGSWTYDRILGKAERLGQMDCGHSDTNADRPEASSCGRDSRQGAGCATGPWVKNTKSVCLTPSCGPYSRWGFFTVHKVQCGSTWPIAIPLITDSGLLMSPFLQYLETTFSTLPILQSLEAVLI